MCLYWNIWVEAETTALAANHTPKHFVDYSYNANEPYLVLVSTIRDLKMSECSLNSAGDDVTAGPSSVQVKQPGEQDSFSGPICLLIKLSEET